MSFSEQFFTPDENAKGPISAEAPKEEAQAAKKGDPRQPKRTAFVKPTECAGCGKALKKRIWYYRNNAYYCTVKCYKRKKKSGAEKAE